MQPAHANIWKLKWSYVQHLTGGSRTETSWQRASRIISGDIVGLQWNEIKIPPKLFFLKWGWDFFFFFLARRYLLLLHWQNWFRSKMKSSGKSAAPVTQDWFLSAQRHGHFSRWWLRAVLLSLNLWRHRVMKLIALALRMACVSPTKSITLIVAVNAATITGPPFRARIRL